MYDLAIEIRWSNATFLLYIGIIIVCYLFCVVLAKFRLVYASHRHSMPIDLLWVAGVLIFFRGFSTCGRDLLHGYYFNFQTATSIESIYDYTLEIGFRVLMVLINRMFHEYWIFVLIVAILTVLPVIYVINKRRDYIDVPIAVLFYVSIFYFSSFSPIRNYLASSIALLAFDALLDKKTGRALFWLGLSICFHRSMIFLFMPFYFSVSKICNKKVIAAGLSSIFLIVYFGGDFLSNFFVGRYAIYELEDEIHIGMQKLVYYVPLFVMFFFSKKHIEDKRILRVTFSYLESGFFMGLLEYVASIFGRVQAAFLPLTIIVAYYSKVIKEYYPGYKKIIDLLIFLYCMARFLIFIIEYYNLEDLMPYTNFFGWIF